MWSLYDQLNRHQRLLRLEHTVRERRVELSDGHFRIKGQEKWCEAVEEMQNDLDAYLQHYNNERSHQGLGMNGRTPYQAFLVGILPEEAEAGKDMEEAA